MRQFRLVVWALVALAAVAVGALLLRAPQPAALPAPQMVGTVGGPFTLTGTDGKPFSSQRLNGTPRVLFFGFTHCPDVCPTTLSRLAKLRKQLGNGDSSFQIVFISVDPERDTPAEMAKYAALFGTPIVALTGTPAEVQRVTKLFGIYAKKVAQPGGDYTMDHTASVMLFDRHDDFIGTIAPDESDAAALAKLKRLTD